MRPQTRQWGNQISCGPSPRRQPVRAPCAKLVDARGTHGISCKRGTARAIRHHQLNDIVSRALVRANIPSVLEPSALSRGEGKRPDSMTLIPWQGGKNVTWNVTVTDTVADSYLHLSAACAGRGGQQKGNQVRRSRLLVHLHPARFRNLRTNQRQDTKFLQELGRRLRTTSDDPRESAFLLKRISITLQHFNAIDFSDTFILASETEFEA